MNTIKIEDKSLILTALVLLVVCVSSCTTEEPVSSDKPMNASTIQDSSKIELLIVFNSPDDIDVERVNRIEDSKLETKYRFVGNKNLGFAFAPTEDFGYEEEDVEEIIFKIGDYFYKFTDNNYHKKVSETKLHLTRREWRDTNHSCFILNRIYVVDLTKMHQGDEKIIIADYLYSEKTICAG